MKLLILFIFSIISFNSNILYSQNRIYVNPSSGNDNGNNGRNIQFPLKTIQAAGFICHGGDTIFIRGGHYTAFHDMFWQIDTSGSAPVWIMPYFNESVILDGSGYTFQEYQAVLSIEHSRNVVVKDLHIMNNNFTGSTIGGPGLRVVSNINPLFITKNVLFKNCKVHNTFRQGILVQAKNVTVDSCEVYNAVQRNVNGSVGTGGWDFAVGTYLWPDNIDSWTNITFKNNKIYNSWGEGIVALRCHNFIIENNHVYDCFSAYIYVDNSRKGIIRNNWVHSTNNTYNRQYTPTFNAPGIGIQWAAEQNSYGVDSLISDLEIYNNLIVRTNSPISWWRDPNNTRYNNSYKNINVYYNTIFKTYGYQSFYLDPNTSGIRPPENCNFKNNIICLGQFPFENPNAYQFYITPNSSHTSSWNFDNNCFINGTIPANIPVQNNITGAPSFMDSTNINLDVSFKLKLNSNCRSKATAIVGINKDYFNTFRDNPIPCIGFHEYGGTSGTGFNGNEILNDYLLGQNFPNPFNPQTTINFELPRLSKINLIVYDIFGREIEKLLNDETKNVGQYKIQFDGTNYPSGIYFYCLTTDGFTQTKKMMLIK